MANPAYMANKANPNKWVFSAVLNSDRVAIDIISNRYEGTILA